MSRKILASLLALMMLIGIAPMAFATEGVVKETLPTDPASATGDGDVYYFNANIIQVLVPTDNSFGFVLDPQGLSTIGEGKTAVLSDLEGGLVLPKSPAVIINESAMAIVAGVTFEAVAEDTAITFVTDKDDVEEVGADSATPGPNNILLYATPSSNNFTKTDDPFAKSNAGYLFDNDATHTDDAGLAKLDFLLGAASHTVKREGDEFTAELVPGSGNGVGIQIAGFVNQLADWSDYTGETPDETIQAKVTYTLEAAADYTGDKTLDTTNNSPHLLTPANTNVAITGLYTAPEYTPATVSTFTTGKESLSFTFVPNDSLATTPIVAFTGDTAPVIKINGTEFKGTTTGILTYTASTKILKVALTNVTAFATKSVATGGMGIGVADITSITMDITDNTGGVTTITLTYVAP